MTSIRTRRVAAAWLAAVLVAVGVPVGAAMANQTWCVNPAFTVPHGYLGGSGNDTITGNNNDNNMDGAGGNDTLSSLDGADHVCGSPGTDSITLGSSGGATEFAEGGTDGDTILGLTGVDYASGQGGADDIEGGQGDDNLYGNDGGDDLKGEKTTTICSTVMALMS